MTAIPSSGNPAPDFELPCDGGKTVSLSGYRGRPLVLFFYPRDDTSVCTREVTEFDAALPRFEAAGTALLGISADSVSKHARFRKKYGFGVDLAADDTRQMLLAYGVWAEKSMYGRKYMGIVRTTLLIDARSRIARVWEKVSVPGHVEEVLTTIATLGRPTKH